MSQRNVPPAPPKLPGAPGSPPPRKGDSQPPVGAESSTSSMPAAKPFATIPTPTSAFNTAEIAEYAAQAMADLSWYTQAPTVPMGYATGWALINTSRSRLQAITPDFSLRDFHDQLLAAGSIGLPWVIRRAFGEPFWNSVRQSVLKPL